MPSWDVSPPSSPSHLLLLLLIPIVAATVVAVAVFLNVHRSYAGFFTVNGESQDGCLSYSFGLAIGSLLTNLMGGVLAIVAFVYAYRKEKSEEDDYDE